MGQRVDGTWYSVKVPPQPWYPPLGDGVFAGAVAAAVGVPMATAGAVAAAGVVAGGVSAASVARCAERPACSSGDDAIFL